MQTIPRITRRRYVTAADPAVNNFAELVVPAGVMWEVVCGEYAITTVAVTGAAFPNVIFLRAGTDDMWQYQSGQDVGVAKTGAVYITTRGSFLTTTKQPAEEVVVPALRLFPTDMIQYAYYSSTGDVQVSAVTLTVEETLLGY